MRIFITGATGFLGGHLLEKLSPERKTVVCLVRTESSGQSLIKKGFRVARGDLTDICSLKKATKGIDIAIHLAAEIDASDSSCYETVNTGGTLNLIKVCRENKVKKIIFISSIQAKYDTVYGISKNKAEEIIIDSGMDYVILRPALIYGEGDNKNLTKLAALIKRFPVIPLIGTGRYLRQPVYVGDVVNAISRVIQTNKKNAIYSIGGPDQIRFRDILKKISVTLNVRRIFIPVPISLIRIIGMGYWKLTKNPIITKIQLESLIINQTFSFKEIYKTSNDLKISFNSFEDKIGSLLR